MQADTVGPVAGAKNSLFLSNPSISECVQTMK